MVEDNNGTIWFATSGGLSSYDGENWKQYTTENGLAHNSVNALLADSSGKLWCATSGGISIIDSTKITSYTIENGLSSNECYFVAEKDSLFYIGTDKGLNRFYGEKFWVHTVEDAPSLNEMDVHFQDSRGNLWFYGSNWNGVMKFDITADNIHPPPVHITRIQLFEKTIDPADEQEFTYEENYFRFDFTGICFTAPEKVTYKYKLEGLDKDWLETAERSTAYPFPHYLSSN